MRLSFVDTISKNAVGRTGFEPVTSSVSGLLGGLAHVRQARSRCLRCCPGVTVTILGRPPYRARGGHAAWVATTVGTSAPWSSPLSGDIRITRVLSCIARAFKARPSFMFAGCCWWRSLAIDGRSGTSRGHGSVMRRPGSRWDGAVQRPSAFRPDISQVATDRASVLRCRRSRPIARWSLLLLSPLLSAAISRAGWPGVSGLGACWPLIWRRYFADPEEGSRRAGA